MHSPHIRQVAAFVVSTSLHAAFLALVMQSGSQALIEAETQARSKKQLIASLFFLQDPHAVRLDGYTVHSVDETPTITLPIPELPEIAAVAADSFEKGDALESVDDVAEAERLQGIYVKQINDRVARVLQMALMQAAAEPAAGTCTVHIIQNENGDVLDVDTNDCAFEALARERVARAIRGASPLPAPPDGLAMGSYLTINVQAAVGN